MTMLVVRAHPLAAPRSRTMMLTDAFVDAYTQAHPGTPVQDLRLYDVAVPEIDIDMLTGWAELRGGEHLAHLTGNQQNKITLFDGYTQQFLAADLVVVANPLWNLSVPTRLKAWIDTVVVAGKTFHYTDSGEPEGLVGGKKVVHLQASGGVFNGQDPASQYVKGVLGFLGCEVHQASAEGMDHEPARAGEIMADALERVRALAREV